MNLSNPEVTIRRINGDDKAQWLALWQGYLDFYRADVAPQVTERTFERLGQDEQVYGLVAEDAEGRLLGLMNLVFHPSTWSAVGYCYIERSLCVAAGCGLGVGKAVRTGVSAGGGTRQRRVYWMTQEYNAPARSLYDKIGRRSSFIVYTR